MKKIFTIVLTLLVFYATNKKYDLSGKHQQLIPIKNYSELLHTGSFQYDNFYDIDISKKLNLKNSFIQPSDAVKLDTSADWMTRAAQQIAVMEYNITFDSTANAYQSPNRNNNIRAYFEPGVFTMKNRVDSVGHNWTVKLINQGIYTDGKVFELPQQNATASNTKNEISIQHCSFEEQYINGPEGVRQNFIIHNAPAQTGELQVKMKVEGLLVEKVNEKELHFYRQKDEYTENFIIYNDLKVWDANNTKLEAHFETDNNEIAIVVNAKDAQYPITIDPLNTSAPDTKLRFTSLLSSNFGRSVSTAGDVNNDGYSDVIVGAPEFDGGQDMEGAILLFYGSATGIADTIGKMIEGDRIEGQLGWSVSTAGDVNRDGYSDIIAGAPGRDIAFICYGSSIGLLSANRTELSPQGASGFGCSVSTAGDANNDGYSDVIIGASYTSGGQNREGRAYIYYGSANGINTIYGCSMESNQTRAHFGKSVACAGDVNGDGYSDVIVGAPNASIGQMADVGKIFVYYGSAAGIIGNSATIITGTQDEAMYGCCVSSAGDVNGDGYSDVIVGAYLQDIGVTDGGAAFIYLGSSLGLLTSNVTMLKLNDKQYNDQFGFSVACAGDINGDGYSDVMVGAYLYEDGGEVDEGGAFIYYGSAQGITNTTPPAIILESNENNARLGFSVAPAGDVNGDGYSDIIMPGTLTAVYIYHGGPSGLNLAAAASVLSNQNNAHLGTSVAFAGDVNGDGYSDIIVGAPDYDNGQMDEGAAFVYLGGTGWGITTTASVMLEANQANAKFGTSVASAGDVNGDGYADVIVGAPFFDDGQTNEGGAFIYFGSATGTSYMAATSIESNQANAQFGTSVASAGDINGDGYSDIVVGAPYYDYGQTDEGVAFIYNGSASSINTNPTPVSMLQSNKIYAKLGYSVASAGDVNGDGYSDVIIGAPGYSNGQASEGVALVFHGAVSGINVTAATLLEADQVASSFGSSVASAGDMNGDGFSDVIIGADGYDNGQLLNVGAAFIYQGSPVGVDNNIITKVKYDEQAQAKFGTSVASAGDVNGDGYSDVIVGAPLYDNGQQSAAATGLAVVYHGYANLFNTTLTHRELSLFPTVLVSNQAHAYFGYSVASGGDANGDGFSDVIIGASGAQRLYSDEGKAILYLGNKSSTSRNIQNIRLYNPNLSTLIKQSNTANNTFGVSLYSKSFLGRNTGKLVWEVIVDGQGFSSSTLDSITKSITNSVQYSGKQTPYTDLGKYGKELKAIVNKEIASLSSKIRVRIEYDKAKAFTGQIYGPWHYMPGFVAGITNHNNVPRIYNSLPRNHGMVNGRMADSATQEPILPIIDGAVKVYPNPVSNFCTLEFTDIPTFKQIDIYNLSGQLIKTINISNLTEKTLEVDLSDVSAGMYYFQGDEKILNTKIIKVDP